MANPLLRETINAEGQWVCFFSFPELHVFLKQLQLGIQQRPSLALPNAVTGSTIPEALQQMRHLDCSENGDQRDSFHGSTEA